MGRRQGRSALRPARGGDRARHRADHQDTCNSTKITVKRGVVQVRDFVKRKNVTSQEGHRTVLEERK